MPAPTDRCVIVGDLGSVAELAEMTDDMFEKTLKNTMRDMERSIRRALGEATFIEAGAQAQLNG